MLSWQFLSATKRGLNDAQLEMIAHRLFGKSCLSFLSFAYFVVNWLDFHLKIKKTLKMLTYLYYSFSCIIGRMLDFKKKISHFITFTLSVDEFYLNYLNSQQNLVPTDLSD